jgi:hypothetical protein
MTALMFFLVYVLNPLLKSSEVKCLQKDGLFKQFSRIDLTGLFQRDVGN